MLDHWASEVAEMTKLARYTHIPKLLEASSSLPPPTASTGPALLEKLPLYTSLPDLVVVPLLPPILGTAVCQDGPLCPVPRPCCM